MLVIIIIIITTTTTAAAATAGTIMMIRRRSEPTAKFGTRQQLGGPSNGIKAYTGKEFERENLELVGPGPGRYDVGRKVKDNAGMPITYISKHDMRKKNAGDFESALDSTPKYSFAGGSYSREAEPGFLLSNHSADGYGESGGGCRRMLG